MDIKHCPSCLDEGFSTYSPKAVRSLFDGHKVGHQLDFDIDGLHNSPEIVEAMHRISVSGVQEKFPAVIEKGGIRIAREGEQSTYMESLLPRTGYAFPRKGRRFILQDDSMSFQTGRRC